MHKNKNFFLVLFFLIFSAGMLLSVSGVSAAELKYELLEKVPGTANLGSDLKGYVEAIYKIALIVLTLSAVLMVSIGGFMYLTSAGNTSAMGSAKTTIVDALIGLTIALSAYLLLYVINPDLVDVSLNGLSPVPITQMPSGTQAPGTSTKVPSGTYTGTNVGGCLGCVPIMTGIKAKLPSENGCSGSGPCQLNETLQNKIKNINYPNFTWWITESWPPAADHLSTCHYNGTCTDINFTDTSKNSSVSAVKTFYTSITNAGLNALYETQSDCSPYFKAGVPCKATPKMTGSHFHVY